MKTNQCRGGGGHRLAPVCIYMHVTTSQM